MGLLDSVLGSVLGGNSGGTSSPMGTILAGLLGGGQGQGGGLLGGQGGQSPAMGGVGGIAGLLSMFQNAGLGQVAQSWVGNGPNQAVSPQQLTSVFGQDRVNTMAGQAGLPPQDFLSQLSQHLPNAVDQMTPNGQVPDEGSVSV